MEPSLERLALKLSSSQRDFLIEHSCGMRPFLNAPVENKTRKSLVERELVTYDPPTRSLLGIPNGTVLTDDGREVLCFILGRCADNLTQGLWSHERVIDMTRETRLFQALAEASEYWKKHERNPEIHAPRKTIGHAYDRPAVPTKS
jgi:hypothetical protein